MNLLYYESKFKIKKDLWGEGRGRGGGGGGVE